VYIEAHRVVQVLANKKEKVALNIFPKAVKTQNMQIFFVQTLFVFFCNQAFTLISDLSPVQHTEQRIQSDSRL